MSTIAKPHTVQAVVELICQAARVNAKRIEVFAFDGHRALVHFRRHGDPSSRARVKLFDCQSQGFELIWEGVKLSCDKKAWLRARYQIPSTEWNFTAKWDQSWHKTPGKTWIVKPPP